MKYSIVPTCCREEDTTLISITYQVTLQTRRAIVMTTACFASSGIAMAPEMFFTFGAVTSIDIGATMTLSASSVTCIVITSIIHAVTFWIYKHSYDCYLNEGVDQRKMRLRAGLLRSMKTPHSPEQLWMLASPKNSSLQNSQLLPVELFWQYGEQSPVVRLHIWELPLQLQTEHVPLTWGK